MILKSLYRLEKYSGWETAYDVDPRKAFIFTVDLN